MGLKEIRVRLWTGLIWLIIETSGRCAHRNGFFEFHKMKNIS